ncbi:MAG: hypothetical protein AAGI52_16650 [Bacteroidota bacterium]
MPSLSAPRLNRSRLLRGVAVGAVLLGYLGVLLGTSAGQGWRLLAHLATETHAVMEAPRLQAPALHAPTGLAPAMGMTTLRAPAHSHGAHTHGDHTHRHGSAHPEAHRTVRTSGSPHGTPEADGFHAHDGVLHSHDLPPPTETPVVILTLDHHQVPTPVRLTPPPVGDTARLGSALGSIASAQHSVETPPPRLAG